MASPLFIIIVLLGLNPVKYERFDVLTAMIVGVIAYNWFLWQFIISARPKFINKLIGLDKLYRIHGMIAIISLVLASAHGLILEEIYKESLLTFLGTTALYIYLAVSILSVIIVTKGKWLKVRLFRKFYHKLIDLKLAKYESNKKFHNITVIGMVSMQIHVLMTSNATKFHSVFTIYMSYFLIAIGFYLYHKLLRNWIIKENDYRIQSIQQEALNVWTVNMKSLHHQMKYKPGQFAFLKFYVNGLQEEHPFSLSSAPIVKGELSITVKELGDFTSKISQLGEGDAVIIDGPYGDFTYLNNPSEKELVFIAGGVGITPVISMLRYMRQYDRNRKVTLLWGMQKEADYIYKNELYEIKANMTNLNVIPVMSNDVSYTGEQGYIDIDLITRYTQHSSIEDHKTGFYICGPSVLRKSVVKNLLELGILQKRIHYEAFTF